MPVYVYLAAAVLFEVTGTLLLPLTQNFTKLLPTAVLAVCYLLAFYLLTFVVRVLPISVTYAIWSGLGVFLIAVFGYVVFHQALNWQTIAGLCLIVGGVVVVNIYSPAHA